ncbi:MAG: DUF642 domain-containing protein [Pseudomonadota bacterium]
MNFANRLKLAAATMLLGCAQAQAGLIVNGSFESDAIASSWAPVSTVTGWSSSASGSSAFEIQRDVAHGGQTGFNTHAADGVQYVELNTDRMTSIWQNVATVAGASYSLSFAYAGRPDTAGQASSLMNVYWGGVKLTAAPLVGLTNDAWQYFTLSGLHASSASTQLKFESVGPTSANTYGSYLDDVSVTRVVPEPGSLAIVALGLCLIGATARRKPRA